jgi:hypothetical protein
MFIVVVSKTSVVSPWVAQELDIAMNRHINGHKLKVLPILLGPIPENEVPSFLRGRRFADFRDRGRRAYQAALSDLVKTIFRIVPVAGGVKDTGAPVAGYWWSMPGTAPSGPRVNRLILFWTQLALANTAFTLQGYRVIPELIGVFGILLLFPISALMSRLLNRDAIASVLLGGLVCGIIGGGLASLVVDGAAKEGFMYGAFFGAWLTSYWSATDKSASLLWSGAATLLFVAVFLIGTCASCVDFGFAGGRALAVGGFTLLFGTLITPGIVALMHEMDALMPRMGRFLGSPEPPQRKSRRK